MYVSEFRNAFLIGKINAKLELRIEKFNKISMKLQVCILRKEMKNNNYKR